MELNSKENNGGNSMDYGQTNLNDIIGLRGVGVGLGYGYGAGSYPGYGQFASPSSNAVRLDRNAQYIENQADCTREVLSADIAGVRQSFENLARDNQFAAITKAVSDGHCQINNNINNSEFRNIDRISNIEREMAANARAAAECCCDTKLLIKDTTIDNLRAEAATANKDSILSAMNSQTNALSCAINSLGQIVQNICAPRCCPTQG